MNADKTGCTMWTDRLVQKQEKRFYATNQEKVETEGKAE